MLNTAAMVNTVLAAIPDAKAIYLFGSTDTAYEKPESDVDIAVLPTKKMSFEERFELMNQLMEVMHKDKIDLIDLLKVPPALKMQVVTKGKRYYSADPYEVALFEDRVFSEYLNFNEERKALVNDILNRGSVY